MSTHVDHVTAPEDHLSVGQKFAYGLGAIANNLLGGAIGYMSKDIKAEYGKKC